MDIIMQSNIKFSFYNYESSKKDFAKQIKSLEESKDYIINNMKKYVISSSIITDMPSSHNMSDLSDKLCITTNYEFFEEIYELDRLILELLMQDAQLDKDYYKWRKKIDWLSDDEKKVLEGRVYGRKVFIITKKVSMSEKHFYYIKNNIFKKIGVEI